MKKYLLLGCMALLLQITSCTKEGYNEFTNKINAPALTIITSLNDGSTLVSSGYYTFDIKTVNYDSTVTLSSPDLIAENTTLKFQGTEQTFKTTGYDCYVTDVKAVAGNTGMEINNDAFLASAIYDETYNKYGYYYNMKPAGKYTLQENQLPQHITVAKYDIGTSYRVNTFQVNTFFVGTTTTTYPQSEEPFVTDNITYRFIVNPDKESASGYSAVMVIYDAKFSGSDKEPTKAAVIVEGLAVEFLASGIRIYGENIVPGVVEAGEVTPYPSFTFNKVEFNTTDPYYIHGKLDYKVAGVFNGSFEGAYLNSYYIK